jgi:hypothetical protein
MIRPGMLIPSLAAAALFFGWQTYDAWTRPVGAVGATAPGAPAIPIGVAPADAPTSVDLSSPVASIVARPVFRPDRRPFREDQAGIVPKRNYDSELARFTLLGVLLLGKDMKGVVVGKGGAGRDERWEVSPGDSLPGFMVKDVGAEGLTLVADDREFLLPLYAGGPKGQPGQAPIRTDTSPARQAAPSQQPPAGQAGAGTVRARPGAAAPAPAVSSQPAAASPAPEVAPTAPATPAQRARDFGRDRTRTRPVYTPGRR